MVKQTPVSVGWQTLFVILPYIWVIAFYRIEKLRMGILLLLGALGISIATQIIFPYPYGFGLALIGTILLPIYFIRRWSIEWNAKFLKKSEAKDQEIEEKPVQEDDEDKAIEILKQRYAKGEITQEEFEQKKNDLKNS